MKNKIMASALAIVILLSFGVCKNIKDTAANITDDTETTLAEDLSDNKNNTTWNEVPIVEDSYSVYPTYPDFDLKKIITESDYVFSGTVINRKEYEVQWFCEDTQWGPYPSSVIEVEINKEYHGKSPVEGKTIKIYYPQSLSANIDSSFKIKDNCEYVFLTNNLDKQFVEKKLKESPDDKFEQEKYADVYISNSLYNIIPVDNESVSVYSKYFTWNNKFKNKKISNKSIAKDRVSSPDLIENEMVVALDKTDFDSMFLELFDNSNELPNANELNEFYKQKVKK